MTLSTFVISITPFDADGRFDEAAFRSHLDRMADAGVGVYLGGGGSGEGFTLSLAESRRVLEVGVDQLAGRVPVRAMGIEPRTAQEMTDYLLMATDAGVDAAQVYSLDPGHGHRPSPAEVEAYLGEVLANTALPCVVSSHMSVGYRLSPSMLQSMASQFDHLIGVNCSHPDLAPLISLAETVGDRSSSKRACAWRHGVSVLRGQPRAEDLRRSDRGRTNKQFRHEHNSVLADRSFVLAALSPWWYQSDKGRHAFTRTTRRFRSVPANRRRRGCDHKGSRIPQHLWNRKIRGLVAGKNSRTVQVNENVTNVREARPNA